MKAKVIAILALLAIVGTAIAQKDKKWTEWDKKEAQKMLDDSPWAKTQSDANAEQQMYTPTADNRLGTRGVTGSDSAMPGVGTTGQGATNQATNVAYSVRFFSARPIRQALARSMQLSNSGLDAAAIARLRNFAEVKSPDSIIVTVSFRAASGTDQRSLNPVMQAFSGAATGTLKNNTYLQRSDGKQLFLQEYIPPGTDGFGARFIFLRMPEEKLFIDAGTKEIRFYSEVSKSVKVDRRFKVADMMYQGELEY